MGNNQNTKTYHKTLGQKLFLILGLASSSKNNAQRNHQHSSFNDLADAAHHTNPDSDTCSALTAQTAVSCSQPFSEQLTAYIEAHRTSPKPNINPFVISLKKTTLA
ncbi:hypothetical protein BB561_003728 [Smittium simulii]|uniref:Uncharacterized protein n=1 Tax=Smittium simulii TaxID=133385 RepID=A0A2T9YJS7_9FUNG|nr:hypothetical protein BB561_003728 [Smittium simulii]